MASEQLQQPGIRFLPQNGGGSWELPRSWLDTEPRAAVTTASGVPWVSYTPSLGISVPLTGVVSKAKYVSRLKRVIASQTADIASISPGITPTWAQQMEEPTSA